MPGGDCPCGLAAGAPPEVVPSGPQEGRPKEKAGDCSALALPILRPDIHRRPAAAA
jgi:hypothetical protein